jgi:hypothetical protein
MNEKKAEEIYKDILINTVYPLVGKKTTYGHDLETVCKKYLGDKFKGVYPSDKLKKLTPTVPYAIYNLDNSNQGGSHWVAVVRHANDIVVYDSFGRKAKDIIPSLTNSTGKIINTDDDAEQKVSETDCGARCVCFLFFCELYGVKNALLI